MLAIFDVEGVLYDAEYLPVLAEKLNKEMAEKYPDPRLPSQYYDEIISILDENVSRTAQVEVLFSDIKPFLYFVLLPLLIIFVIYKSNYIKIMTLPFAGAMLYFLVIDGNSRSSLEMAIGFMAIAVNILPLFSSYIWKVKFLLIITFAGIASIIGSQTNELGNLLPLIYVYTIMLVVNIIMQMKKGRSKGSELLDEMRQSKEYIAEKKQQEEHFNSNEYIGDPLNLNTNTRTVNSKSYRFYPGSDISSEKLNDLEKTFGKLK